ncbi:LysR family transcriptional regulator [Aminobacter niigataensis]|uniref:LysR family nitrogen assimilation transcriptional regulator n=1 Tax=Aminobacter niigataensis TaxID=83265 RepID=A0ABR6LAC8_9HYPH|nr:LysR family transcriptional regulator [Aminobacter niigataensis]MBB4653189.1 LysR family nitrogen assimilation transcriptional regulator [Aminobacter niigataensis]CAI2933119.1 Cyn operon transcriptional activator [Aminobacter niigataensis]
MELRQLEYFLAIIEGGSLSKAATVVGIAQPALSRRMRQLEEELNVQLFYRHGRGIRLTSEGKQLQSVVAPIIRDLEQVRSELRESSVVPTGKISFGVPPSISAAIGAEIVAKFSRRFPHVKVHLVDGLSGFINEWLTAGRIDMAVINHARRSPYMRMDYLMSVDLFLFGPRDDIDAISPNSDVFPTSDLTKLPLLLVGRHHGLRRELDGAMRKLGLELNVKAEVDALVALKNLVRGGHGFTVLPHGLILPEVGNRDFGFRRLVEPGLRQDFMIAFSLQTQTTRAMRELAKLVRTEVSLALNDGRLVGHVEQRTTARIGDCAERLQAALSGVL